MNTTEEAQRQINNQLSENREATIEGVPKDLKDEITWEYVEDGFEVTTTHRENGTYDLTIREGSGDSEVSPTEAQRIARSREPDEIMNGFGIYLTSKPYHDGFLSFHLPSGYSADQCSMEWMVLEDEQGATVALPLIRIPQASLQEEVEVTSTACHDHSDFVWNPEKSRALEVTADALSAAAGQKQGAAVFTNLEQISDFKDEEIGGIAQLVYEDDKVVNQPILIDDNGNLEVLDQSKKRLEKIINRYRRKKRRESEPFRIQIKDSIQRDSQVYIAWSGDDFTLLLPMVNPKRLPEGDGIYEEPIIGDRPLFVSVFNVKPGGNTTRKIASF